MTHMKNNPQFFMLESSGGFMAASLQRNAEEKPQRAIPVKTKRERTSYRSKFITIKEIPVL